MNTGKSLLIELGTEELPPRALDELSAAFLRGIVDGLATRGVSAGLDQAMAYASPRRLAAYIPAVASAQPEQAIERRGPAVAAALDAEGQPSKALLGFAQSCGVDVSQLEKLETDKGAWFVWRAVKPGRPLAALLPEIIDEALKALPIPRPMRWADHDYSFVRPAHWLVILHGADIVDGKVLGLVSGRKSRGHRFMHPQPVHVADADGWLDAMRAAKVLADPRERRQRIQQQIELTAQGTGGTPQLDDVQLRGAVDLDGPLHPDLHDGGGPGGGRDELVAGAAHHRARQHHRARAHPAQRSPGHGVWNPLPRPRSLVVRDGGGEHPGGASGGRGVRLVRYPGIHRRRGDQDLPRGALA